MPTSTNVTNLKINELTEAQYDAAVQGGVIGANELSILTDMDDAIQFATMPTASIDYLGRIVEFTGTTDSTYTNGYFYKCVSDGQNPATYSWVQTNVQPTPSGLPDQTGNSGKFLTTDGTDASWEKAMGLPSFFEMPTPGVYVGSTANPLIMHVETYTNSRPKKGYSFSKSNVYGDGLNINIFDTTGFSAREYVLCKNDFICTSNLASSLGRTNFKWANVYTQKLNNGADINIPTTGGTMAVMNTPSTMPELAVADWSSNTQTVNVTGVTASNVVFVSPAPASAADYAAAGIVCTAQGADTLTFTCTTVPSNAITVNVVILG